MMKCKSIETLAELLSMEFYRFKRYQVPVCLILIEIEDKLFYEIAANTIRRSDLCKQIEKDFYAIVYAHADMDNARNAFFNIFVEMSGKSNISRLAIAQALESDTSEHDVIQRVYKELSDPKDALIFV